MDMMSHCRACLQGMNGSSSPTMGTDAAGSDTVIPEGTHSMTSREDMNPLMGPLHILSGTMNGFTQKKWQGESPAITSTIIKFFEKGKESFCLFCIHAAFFRARIDTPNGIFQCF